MKYFFIPLAVLLSGCVATMPGVSGKTKLNISFDDNQTSDILDANGNVHTPGEGRTTFDVNIEAPQGVAIEQIAQMLYQLNEDGTFLINVNGETVADTTKQGEMIKEIAAMDAVERQEFMNKVLGVIAANNIPK